MEEKQCFPGQIFYDVFTSYKEMLCYPYHLVQDFFQH